MHPPTQASCRMPRRNNLNSSPGRPAAIQEPSEKGRNTKSTSCGTTSARRHAAGGLGTSLSTP